MQRYPVYHTGDSVWKGEQLEALFGGVIEWVVADGAERGTAEGLREFSLWPEAGMMSVEQHGSLREVMLLLSVMELTNLMRMEATARDIARVEGWP